MEEQQACPNPGSCGLLLLHFSWGPVPSRGIIKNVLGLLECARVSRDVLKPAHTGLLEPTLYISSRFRNNTLVA